MKSPLPGLEFVTGLEGSAMTSRSHPVFRPGPLGLIALAGLTGAWLLAGLSLPAGAQGRVPPRVPSAGLTSSTAPAAGAVTHIDLAATAQRAAWHLGGKGYDVAFEAQETRSGG